MHTEWAKSVLFHFQTDVWPWGCAVQRSPSLFSISFSPPLFQLRLCLCVLRCILCHHVYVYISCLGTGCSMHHAFLIVARSAAPGLCSPPCANSRMPDQMPNRKFDLVCSTLWLTLTRRPRKEALCFWLAVASWDRTLKTVPFWISWFTGYFCFNVSCTIHQEQRYLKLSHFSITDMAT